MSVSVLAAPSEDPELVLEVKDSRSGRITGLALGQSRLPSKLKRPPLRGGLLALHLSRTPALVVSAIPRLALVRSRQRLSDCMAIGAA